MKTKHFIALILVLIGTNLFTFATSRYWTTKHVLTRARERVIAYIGKDGGTGPFVRLDFETEPALFPWLVAKNVRFEDESQQKFFATFNSTRIVELNVPATSAVGPQTALRPASH